MALSEECVQRWEHCQKCDVRHEPQGCESDIVYTPLARYEAAAEALGMTLEALDIIAADETSPSAERAFVTLVAKVARSRAEWRSIQ